jgi:hypothetical protein
MKSSLILILLLANLPASADPVLEGEPLFLSAPTIKETEPEELKALAEEGEKKTSHAKKPMRRPANILPSSGNLPAYYSSNRNSNEALVITPQVTKERLWNLKSGDQFEIEIPHSVIAFPDERAPVVAVIKSGQFKGAKILGQSFLEKNSKRIFIDFFKITFNRSTHDFMASALTDEGQTGFIGKYHSREMEYFAGDFSASFVAAYFDGLVPRYRTVFGEVPDTSVDSAVKKGMASGAMSTAERFREKLKKVPEFSELKGPIEGKLLVIDGEKGAQR